MGSSLSTALTVWITYVESEETGGFKEGSKPLEEAAYSLLCFCLRRLPQSNTGWITPDEIYALFIPGFEIIINEVLSSLAHFQAAGSIC